MKNVCCVNIREIHSNFVNHLNQVNQLNSGSDILCPNKEAALVIIVVSLPCTIYLCGSFPALWNTRSYQRYTNIFSPAKGLIYLFSHCSIANSTFCILFIKPLSNLHLINYAIEQLRN